MDQQQVQDVEFKEVQPEGQTVVLPEAAYQILHVQVAGNPTIDELKNVGEAFQKALDSKVSAAVTTTANVSVFKVQGEGQKPFEGILVRGAMTVEDIARTAHEVNGAYLSLDAHMKWEDLPVEERISRMQGVAAQLRYGYTPEQQHEAWMAAKTQEGWTYGEQKDLEKKTNPCLVPYADLPEAMKTKDKIFRAVVQSLARSLPLPQETNRQVEIWNGNLDIESPESWVLGSFMSLKQHAIFRYPEEPTRYILSTSDIYINYLGDYQYTIDGMLVTPGDVIEQEGQKVLQWKVANFQAPAVEAQAESESEEAVEEWNADDWEDDSGDLENWENHDDNVGMPPDDTTASSLDSEAPTTDSAPKQ
jgi:hypothetical protein